MENSFASVINIMTHRLPRELSWPIYNEFQSRFGEAKRVVGRYVKYKIQEDDLDLVA